MHVTDLAPLRSLVANSLGTICRHHAPRKGLSAARAASRSRSSDLLIYLHAATRNQIKLVDRRAEIAKAVVRDMRAFHAEKSPIKRDEIASRLIHVLRQYQGRNERPIKLHHVKEMFEEMWDHGSPP